MTACSWSATRPLTLTVAPMAQERTSDRQVEPTQGHHGQIPKTRRESLGARQGPDGPSRRREVYEETRRPSWAECFVIVVFLRAFVRTRCQDVSSDRRPEKA